MGFIGLVLAGVMHLLFIPLFLLLGVWELSLVNAFSVLVYAYAIFVLGDKTLMTHDDRAIGWLVYGELILHGIVATYYLGLESGFHLYIYTLAMLPFFTQRYSAPVQIARLAGIIVVSLFLNVYFRDYQPLAGVAREYVFVLGNVNLVLFLLITSILIYLYTQSEAVHYDRLFHRSNIDPLTGMYNRRYLAEYCEKVFQNKVTQDCSSALLVIDIDHFKSINDTYGHHFGDFVIQKAADIISQTIGDTGITARWGGEEFVVFLPETDTEKLREAGEKVLDSFRGTVISDGKYALAVSVTCGGAVRQRGESFTELFIQADEALYRGKSSGRNCMCL